MSVQTASEILTAIDASPETQYAHNDEGALHHVMRWSCGCEAVNVFGLCRLEGWQWTSCVTHTPPEARSVETVREDVSATPQPPAFL